MAMMMAGGTAHADRVHDYSGRTGSATYGRTHVRWTTGDGGLQSIMKVTGAGSGQDRARCARADGGTNWYQSTIIAFNGSTSHYDCGNNGTYNRHLTGHGIDLK